MVELESLKEKGITPDLTIDPMSPLITPFDRAHNRASVDNLEHGTCGIGFGSAVRRNEETPYRLYAGDILSPWLFHKKLKKVQEYYSKRMIAGVELLNEIEMYRDYAFQIKDLISTRNLTDMSRFDNLIFEGAQGILLDRDHGIFPHVTRSKTDLTNVHKILRDVHCDSFSVYGVLRSYLTRHGNGPLPFETSPKTLELKNLETETNKENRYQGMLRYAPFSMGLLKSTSRRLGVPRWQITHVIRCMDQLGEKITASNEDGYLRDMDVDKFKEMILKLNNDTWFVYGP